MIRILLYERSCKKCTLCKRAYNTILPLHQNETETFYEKCIEHIGRMENDMHKYHCLMWLPIGYTCKNFRGVMRDPDLSMFICKEYIDLMLRDYVGISQHQVFDKCVQIESGSQILHDIQKHKPTTIPQSTHPY